MNGSLVVCCRVTALGLAAAPLLTGDGRSPWEFLCLAMAGLLHVEAGWRLWRARPGCWMGPLMTASGLLWLVNSWGWTALPVLCGQGLLLSVVYDPLLLHGTLIVASGRLGGRLDRLVAVAGYLFWPAVIGVMWLARDGQVTAQALIDVRGAGYPVIGVGLLVFFGFRYRAATPADRRAFAPFWAAVLVNGVTTTALSTTAYGAAVWPTVLHALGAALVPVGAVVSLARLEKRRLIEAGDRERERVERDVHDGVQQRLLAATLLLRQAQRHRDTALLEQGAAEVETAITELRELVRGLNPPVLVRYGLAGAIASIAERSTVELDVDDQVGAADVPEPVAVTAYYVAMEAVANSQKHAAARAVKISLAKADDRIVVTVRDDGVGGATPVQGGGLYGLRHRVESCGGTFRLASERGQGTTVRASLPLGGRR